MTDTEKMLMSIIVEFEFDCAYLKKIIKIGSVVPGGGVIVVMYIRNNFEIYYIGPGSRRKIFFGEIFFFDKKFFLMKVFFHK